MNRQRDRRIQQRRKLDSINNCQHDQEYKRLYIYRAIEKLNNRMNNHESSMSWIKSVWVPFITAITIVVLFHIVFD